MQTQNIDIEVLNVRVVQESNPSTKLVLNFNYFKSMQPKATDCDGDQIER